MAFVWTQRWGRRMPLSDKIRFSQLSTPRQGLVRLCQSINYGYICELAVERREPVLDPAPAVFIDIKLDSDEQLRSEIDSADFLLTAEVTRLLALFDRLENGKIARLDVRSGIPRRVLYERQISVGDVVAKSIGTVNLPVARQAGSEGPVRRPMVDPERKTAAEEVAGHGRDARGGRRSEGRGSRREYPETTRVGVCFGS
jgi:hypothetical protein